MTALLVLVVVLAVALCVACAADDRHLHTHHDRAAMRAAIRRMDPQ